jgi:hypothetical protein
MKGHIRERSPGHWAIVIDVRDPQTGKRKRRWHSFAGTKRQAQVECARLLTETKNGTGVDPTRMTVATFLERWIEHMEGQVSPRSHERYAELARKNIVPLLGGLGLTKLQPAHISQAYTKALTSGRRDGSGGLSARSVTHMHRVLREALQQAVRWQLLARNPADAVKPPKVERRQMSVLDTDATAGLLEEARDASVHTDPPWRPLRSKARRGRGPALAERGPGTGSDFSGRERRADRPGGPGKGTQERQGPHHRPVRYRGRRAAEPSRPAGAKSLIARRAPH